MKLSIFVSTLILTSTLLVSGAPAPKDDSPSNLLVNGSFEEGPMAGEFWPLNENATDIKGWTVTRGGIDYIGNYWEHADGNRSLDLHGSPGIGGVQQTFKTRKGQKYRVTFYLATNPISQFKTRAVCVTASGQKDTFKIDGTGRTQKDMGWTKKQWDFVAGEDETSLEIYSVETQDTACGPALDNVSVLEVRR
jgi:choice-of-anchor C domain-containing protein